MRRILENLLHIPIEEKSFLDTKKLPLFLKGNYEIKIFSIAGEDILFISPKEKIAFSTLKKQWKKFQELLDIPCVIYGNHVSRYGRQRMIDLGIPFVFGQDNIYLPAMGILFRKRRETKIPEIQVFSSFTQKMVLIAIYQGWTEKTSKEICEEMGVSRMTVNRALVELEALDLPFTALKGKTRFFLNPFSPKELYDCTKNYMTNPIIKNYNLSEISTNVLDKGGMSALAEYCMIADNSYVTYAVDREEARQIQLDASKRLPKSEIPVCVVQVLKYKIRMDEKIDPISAILCLTEDEKSDPRVEGEIAYILEDIWNGKWNQEV